MGRDGPDNGSNGDTADRMWGMDNCNSVGGQGL